jgi:hypothetical protein
MNDNRRVLVRKRRRVHEPHVQPLNELVEHWRQEGRQVPWADPDSGGIHSKILFLLESPGPAASTEHGSGFISSDNDDRTAELFWRLSTQAGLDRRSYISWNVVPWYVSATGPAAGMRSASTTSRCPATVNSSTPMANAAWNNSAQHGTIQHGNNSVAGALGIWG